MRDITYSRNHRVSFVKRRKTIALWAGSHFRSSARRRFQGRLTSSQQALSRRRHELRRSKSARTHKRLRKHTHGGDALAKANKRTWDENSIGKFRGETKSISRIDWKSRVKHIDHSSTSTPIASWFSAYGKTKERKQWEERWRGYDISFSLRNKDKTYMRDVLILGLSEQNNKQRGKIVKKR